MSLQITGTLIHKENMINVNDKFRKREFVIELLDDINGNIYKNYAKMQLVQSKCDILDRFNIGDNLTVDFNVKGNRWEKDGKVQYITNLDAWRVVLSQKDEYAPVKGDATNYNFPSIDNADDLPF